MREVDAMLRPGGVLYVGFQSIATFSANMYKCIMVIGVLWCVTF